MLEQLFGSKTRLKLLKFFYRNPSKAFFVREISRSIDAQINAVRRELEILQNVGLIKEESKEETKEVKKSKDYGANLRKYYKLDENGPIYVELENLLLKENLLGQQDFVKNLQTKAGDLKLLLLSGRFTGDKKSPIDILVVGEVKERALDKMVEQYEKDYGYSLRFTVMTESEFNDRRYVMDKFLYSVFECKHLKAINKMEL